MAQAMSAERCTELANELSVPESALDALQIGWASKEVLRRIGAGGSGWDPYLEGAWSFAEHDGRRRLVGFSYRTRDGLKGAVSATRPGLRARLAAVSERALGEMREGAARCGGGPDHLEAVGGDVDRVIGGADAVLACSGTVTLRVARLRKPMVVVYRVEPVGYAAIGKRIVRKGFRALPNIAAHGAGMGPVVPEFIPLEGSARPAIAALEALVSDESARAAQAAGLDRVARLFEGRRSAEEAAGRIHALLAAKRCSSV